jgi:hypothetical protein
VFGGNQLHTTPHQQVFVVIILILRHLLTGYENTAATMIVSEFASIVAANQQVFALAKILHVTVSTNYRHVFLPPKKNCRNYITNGDLVKFAK